MIEEISVGALKSTLGMSMSVIGTEHFFSAGLSSPWSVAKFAQTLEDQKDVWHYFDESATSSLLFGSVLSLTLRSIWPVAGSLATTFYYKNLYKSALDKASQNGIKTNIQNQGLSKTIEEIVSKGSIEEIRNLSKYLESTKN